MIEARRVIKAVQVSAPYFVAIVGCDFYERAVKGWQLGSKNSERRRCSHPSRHSCQGLLDDDLLVGHDIGSPTRNTTFQSVGVTQAAGPGLSKTWSDGLVGGAILVHYSGLSLILPWTWRDIILSWFRPFSITSGFNISVYSSSLTMRNFMHIINEERGTELKHALLVHRKMLIISIL